MERDRYRVRGDLKNAPLRDHMLHGYDSRTDFYRALRRLVERWKDRVGECIGERHGFMLLRFDDTPGGLPDEEWLPAYLLQPESGPAEACEELEDEELDASFGFD
jgi:hypothetical protein